MIPLSKSSRIFTSLTEKPSSGSQTTLVSPKRGQLFLMGHEHYASIRETVYLLSSPANAKRLVESLEQVRR